jgi:hypothetical protein
MAPDRLLAVVAGILQSGPKATLRAIAARRNALEARLGRACYRARQAARDDPYRSGTLRFRRTNSLPVNLITENEEVP